jgi:hypothetical protein
LVVVSPMKIVTAIVVIVIVTLLDLIRPHHIQLLSIFMCVDWIEVVIVVLMILVNLASVKLQPQLINLSSEFLDKLVLLAVFITKHGFFSIWIDVTPPEEPL